MFSLNEILAASAIAGVAVLGACLFSRWTPLHATLAALISTSLVAVWRVGANLADLNSDFFPHVSFGDVGCIIAGGLAPTLMAVILEDTRRWWFPGLIGGVAAFLGNVFILW